MASEPHLVLLKDSSGKFTGAYGCTLCDIEFRPDPNNLHAIHEEFTGPRQLSHQSSKTTREDVNQAAARIVREATERD
jgi:hypothetical protein